MAPHEPQVLLITERIKRFPAPGDAGGRFLFSVLFSSQVRDFRDEFHPQRHAKACSQFFYRTKGQNRASAPLILPGSHQNVSPCPKSSNGSHKPRPSCDPYPHTKRWVTFSCDPSPFSYDSLCVGAGNRPRFFNLLYSPLASNAAFSCFMACSTTLRGQPRLNRSNCLVSGPKMAPESSHSLASSTIRCSRSSSDSP